MRFSNLVVSLRGRAAWGGTGSLLVRRRGRELRVYSRGMRFVERLRMSAVVRAIWCMFGDGYVKRPMGSIMPWYNTMLCRVRCMTGAPPLLVCSRSNMGALAASSPLRGEIASPRILFSTLA